MNLDDKFKELKEEIPEVDSYLGYKIYAKGNQKQLKRNPILNKLTVSICGIILIVLMLIIGPISYNSYQTNQMKSAVTLLKSIEEPTKLSLASPTLGQFYEELNQFSGVLSS
ncbi:MAG: hypothetical protein K2J85_04705, partial [Anaeroplasmataceae bacterium]|nr:hypothetical protein [Anaeroplasmataceae bacterium]